MEWGYNRAIVWVDEATSTLKLGGELVVTASVAQATSSTQESATKKLSCAWEGSWATWDDLKNSAELEALVSKADETLRRADGGGKAKGKKGKNKGH